MESISYDIFFFTMHQYFIIFFVILHSKGNWLPCQFSVISALGVVQFFLAFIPNEGSLCGKK